MIRDKDVIIDNDIQYSEEYKNVTIYNTKQMKEIGNYAWLQFNEIINNMDVSMDFKTTQK